MLTMQAFYEKLVEALPGAEAHYAALARVTRLEPESVTTLADGRTWHDWAQDAKPATQYQPS